MCRLTSCTTEAGSVASDSRATAPTTAWPESKSTIDGVVGDPSAFGRTTGSPALLTCATTDIVVPRSMPNAVLSSSGSATAHAPAQPGRRVRPPAAPNVAHIPPQTVLPSPGAEHYRNAEGVISGSPRDPRAGETVVVGDGVGSTTGAGDSDGIACSSASAIASSPAAFGCSGAGSSGPCTYGSGVHSSCPANCGAAMPNPNSPAPCASALFSCPSRDSSTFSLAGVIPNPCRQRIDDPNGT